MALFGHFFVVCVVIYAAGSVQAYNRLSVHQQCVDKGYEGACIETPSMGVYPTRCGNLMCAESIGRNKYRAQGTGKAHDGTYCSSRKACVNGQCNRVTSETAPYHKDATFICTGMSPRAT